jgi:hypothetical protein
VWRAAHTAKAKKTRTKRRKVQDKLDVDRLQSSETYDSTVWRLTALLKSSDEV